MIPSRGIGIYVGDDIGHRNGSNSITPTHWTMAKDYGIKWQKYIIVQKVVFFHNLLLLLLYAAFLLFTNS